jgi:hypothetical protein
MDISFSFNMPSAFLFNVLRPAIDIRDDEAAPISPVLFKADNFGGFCSGSALGLNASSKLALSVSSGISDPGGKYSRPLLEVLIVLLIS